MNHTTTAARVTRSNKKNNVLTEADIIALFCSAMRERDINVSPASIVADGKLHRIRADGDRDKTAWFVLHADDRPAGMFGCNRRYGYDTKFTWKAEVKSAPMTAAEKRAYRERIERLEAERVAQLAVDRADAAARAKKIWGAATPAETHPYLERKGIQSHGLRVGKWELIDDETGAVRTISREALLVPIRNLKKEILSLQAIFPTKLLGGRDKDYLKGGEKHGTFYSIGRPLQHDGKMVLIIVEGYATGASIHEATGHCVIIAFDAPNLLPVAKVWREKFPDAIIIVAADNDQFTLKPVVNPGLTRAREAAAAVDGIVAVPTELYASMGATNEHGGRAYGPTDFNDVLDYVPSGADSIRKDIDEALNETTRVLPIVYVPACSGSELAEVQFTLDALAVFDDDHISRLSRRGVLVATYNDLDELRAEIVNAHRFMPNASIQVLAKPGEESEATQIATAANAGVRLPQQADGAWRGWAHALRSDMCALIDVQIPVGPNEAGADILGNEPAERVIERSGADQHAGRTEQTEAGFTVLGGARDAKTIFVFSHSSRQIMELRAGSIREGDLIALFPDVNWWEMRFTKKGGIDVKQAIAFLAQRAHKRGVFNPDVKRGRGGWTDAGRTVLHLGDRLIVDGAEMALTKIGSTFIYPMNLALPSPSDTPLSDDEARSILTLASIFKWKRPASAALLAGWVALAPLCGALRWRPHVWVTGGPGSGKTTLMTDFVHELVNGGPDGHQGWAQFLNGNSSEAGVRQDLQDDALPILFDEFEGAEEQDARRVQNMLALARQSSSNTSARILKGTTGGSAMAFRTRSMFAFSSIGVSLKQQADVERVSVLDLLPKRASFDPVGWTKIVEGLSVLRREGYAQRLLRRSIDLLPVTLENIKTFSAVAANKFGSQRDGDQYGTLLAGAWSLQSSDQATAEQARQWIESFEWDEFVDQDEGRASVIDAMFGKAVRLSNGEQVLFGALARRADYRRVEGVHVEPADASAVLALYGVKISCGWMYVSNKGTALRADLLRSSYFAGPDTFKRALREIPGADHNENKPVHFPGIGSDKCSRVPLKSILPDEDEDRAESGGEPF